MKIALITSATQMDEVSRIKEETLKMGHKFFLVDFKEFRFLKKGNNLSFYPQIPSTDLVIVRGLFSTMRSLESLKDYLIFRGVKVFDNHLFEHKYSMNKAYDLLKLILSGVPVPDTFNAREYKFYLELDNKFDFPLVVKSAKAGKGSRVWLLKNNSEYGSFIKDLERKEYPAKNLVVQAYVDYHLDLRVLVLGKRMYAMRRIPKAGDFRANFSLGGSVELFEIDGGLRKLARKAVSAVGLDIAGVDILVGKNNQKYVLEVNHTPGMIGMEKATGENITREYLRYAILNAK